MTLFISSIFEKDFVEDYIPFVIKTYMMDLVTKNKNRVKYIDNYLKENLSTTISDILDNVKFIVTTVDKRYLLTINDSVVEPKSQEKISALLKLLEFGNLEFKGLHIVTKAFNYVRDHLDEIYMGYMLKGGM